MTDSTSCRDKPFQQEIAGVHGHRAGRYKAFPVLGTGGMFLMSTMDTSTARLTSALLRRAGTPVRLLTPLLVLAFLLALLLKEEPLRAKAYTHTTPNKTHSVNHRPAR